jgi:hypothetical protein
MSERRILVCLANSRKGEGGLCFAGVDPETHNWLRPIGSGWLGAVQQSEQILADGSIAGLLDVVAVPLLGPTPEVGQPENWELASGQWERVGTLGRDEARELLERLATDEPVFGNRGKAVHVDAIPDLEESLAVIAPDHVTWRVDASSHVRAFFEHAGRELELAVTDPAVEQVFADVPPGDHNWREDEDCFLVLSITAEAHNDFHTKLVAGVIFFD